MKMLPPRKFWLVWREFGGNPTRMHDSFAEASKEADRLALANPGDKFFVLEAVCAKRATAPVETIDLNDVPF